MDGHGVLELGRGLADDAGHILEAQGVERRAHIEGPSQVFGQEELRTSMTKEKTKDSV